MKSRRENQGSLLDMNWTNSYLLVYIIEMFINDKFFPIVEFHPQLASGIRAEDFL